MRRVPLQMLMAATAAWMFASPAAGEESFERAIVSVEDDRGGPAMAVELSLKTYRPLATPRQHGEFLVDIDVQPGSAEETILRYVQLVGSDDIAGYTELQEPYRGNGPCPCGSRSGPFYRISERFKLLSFEQAWLFRDYQVFQIRFQESAHRSSAVFISTRLQDGRVHIAPRPSDPAYEVASFLLMLADLHRGPLQPNELPPGGLDLSVQIDGGENPLTVHFGGTIHPNSAGWRPADRSGSADPVAAFAAEILATSAELDDETFISLFHPWVSDSVRQRAGRDAEYLHEVRSLYAAGSDIAHVFTFEIGRRLIHTYSVADQPDRLHHMLIMRDGQDLALAGTPPESGIESLMAIDAVQQYLLELWRDQK